jgi:uncharacterized membrane protein
MQYIFNKKNLLALIFIAIGVILLKETYAERVVFYISADELGPMTYPRYLLWGWIGLSVAYLLFPQKPFDASEIKSCLPILAVAITTIIVYMFLFKYAGLFVSTLLFLLLFFYILDYRDPKRMILISMSCSAIVWIVFEKLLAVPMPTGIWGALLG